MRRTCAPAQLADVDSVAGLHTGVQRALGNGIARRDADPHALAVGLLGVLGQMPTVFSFDDAAAHHDRLREMTGAAVAPIAALDETIEHYLAHSRTRLGATATWDVGGSWAFGAGCGGGGGGSS